MEVAHATHAEVAAQRQPGRVARTLRSSIGSKTLMAVTGLGLLAFVIVHMLDNLQIFLGQERYNGFAAFLRSTGPLLWILRIGLLALFVLHVGAAVKVWRANKEARLEPYVFRASVRTGYAARTMIVSGMIVFAFVVYHLLHLTFGLTHPELVALRDPAGHHDVYSMVVLSFREWPVTVSYIVAQVLLCMHISHGASSAFQTLGITHPRWLWLKQGFGPGVATFIAAGNIAIPLACWIGIVQPGTGA